MRICVCSSVHGDSLRFLSDCLRHGGHDVDEWVLLSGDAYRHGSLQRGWRKVPLRLRMYLQYPVWLAWKALQSPRGSILIVTSNPFFAPLLAALIGRVKGLRVIHLLYDLFPDALIVAGSLRVYSWPARILGTGQRWTQRHVCALVALGAFLRRYAEGAYGPARTGAVVDISADARQFPKQLRKTPDNGPLFLHYGGQLGHMHDAESLIAAVREVVNVPELRESYRFDLRLSGACAARATEVLHPLGVPARPAIPAIQWRELIDDFHIGLVSLSPGGATVCLPSKTYAMMAGGLAIIAICPVWSDLASLVRDNGAGWVIDNAGDTKPPEPGTRPSNRQPDAVVAEFVDLLKQLKRQPQRVETARHAAFEAMRARYGLDALSRRWGALLEEACADKNI